MTLKKHLFVALTVTGCAVAWGGFVNVPSANATGSEIRTVTIALSPENAAVAVDGHPRQHPNGALELRGPLGSVFTVEAVANGGSVIERVAITDVGALPARLLVPSSSTSPQPPIPTPLPDALVADECAQRTWWDNSGVKHYKPQCLGLEDVPSGKKATGLGALTIICSPKCDHIVDNGADIGPGHIFNRTLPVGMHLLSLSAPNGVKRSFAVEIQPDQTREVRVTMDWNQPKIAADLLNSALQPIPPPAAAPPPVSATDEGYLTLASYPWTKVSENGHMLCLTPCVKIPLSPGLHVLVLENETAPVQQSASVTIRPGEITVKRFAFK